MQVERRAHDLQDGWDAPLPAMDSEATLVLVFGSRGYQDHPAVFASIERAFPSSVIVGCSTSGEIHQDEVRDDSLSVAIVRFEHTRIRRVARPIVAATGSEQAGMALANELNAADLQHVLVFSDGLHVNGTALVAGMNQVLDPRVVVTGGLAGDGANFERTWVLGGAELGEHTVVGVGFYGSRLSVGHGSRGGWDPFGIERTVTRSVDNVLFELDGRPALALYKEYLGDRADDLPASGLLFPLTITGETEVVRTILAVSEADQSLTFAGDIPQGSRVQLMRANFDRLVDGAEAAAHACDVSEPVLAVAVSCVGRRLVLGERTDEEVDAILDALPGGSVLVGFYSYGELSPVAGGDCRLHNQTMTLTTYREP